ncbi:hypothetical protein [Aureibaculum marinum]|nr:hypothetical protein [Aureibaculum marinum]
MRILKIKLSNKLMLIGIYLVIGFTLSNCNPTDNLKPDNNCDGHWSTEVQESANDYNNALSNYGTDPTSENCNAIKKTGNTYIDALKKVEPCVTTVSKADWEKALEDTRVEINKLNCE